MFFSNKRERKVEELMLKHFDIIKTTLEEYGRMINDYINDNKKFKEDAYNVHQLEHEADVVKHEIDAKLYEGAFLPIYREDYIELIDLVDKIANKAEDTGDYIVLTRPAIPEFLASDLKEMVSETVNSYTPLLTVLKNFQEDMSEVRSAAELVRQKEQKLDEMEWNITKKLFKSNLDLASKLHLKRLIELMEMISNRIEDAADKFEVMVIKRKM